MSDPNALPGGGSNHESWDQHGYGGGQYQGQSVGQGQYPGYYPGQYPAYGGGYGSWTAPPRTHAMTVFAMVTGIVAATISVVPFFGFIAFLLGPLAMVLGIIGIAKRLNRRGFSVTALATGTFGLLVSILYAVLFSTLMSFVDRTDTYEFVAASAGEFHVSLTTTETTADVSDTRVGTFKERHAASTLFGGVVATNFGDNDGTVSCEVFDSNGYLLVDDEAKGPGAQAQCMIGASWLENGDDFSVTDQLKATSGN